VGSKAFGGLNRRLKEKTAESRWFETTGQAPFGRAKAAYWKINGPNCESKGVPLQPSEVHGDHIIARSRFKNPKDADRLGNLQIVCTNCHRAKTQNDLRVLSRMRSKPQVRF
jgi:5-methylcytosine-specific restriction endonuclease McrA